MSLYFKTYNPYHLSVESSNNRYLTGSLWPYVEFRNAAGSPFVVSDGDILFTYKIPVLNAYSFTNYQYAPTYYNGGTDFIFTRTTALDEGTANNFELVSYTELTSSTPAYITWKSESVSL